MRVLKHFLIEQYSLVITNASPATSSPALPESFGVSTRLIDVTLNLALVLGAIMLFAWIVKRVQGLDHGGAGQLRVTASLPLGPKERLLVVEVGEQQILLGASHAGICALHVLETPLNLEPVDDLSFRDKLLQAVKGSTT